MKAFLMHPERDSELGRSLPAAEETLTADLELKTLWEAMAAGDQFLFEVARRALLLGLEDRQEIVYRQQALRDCLENPDAVRELYKLTGDALAAQKSIWAAVFGDSPSSLLSTSVKRMALFVDSLKRLRELAAERAGGFRSPAFARFFAMIAEELDEAYLERVEEDLKALDFKGGTLMSARLGAGNKGRAYALRRGREQGWLGRMLDRSTYGFSIPDRDESGYRALSELRDRGLAAVANVLAQAVEHVRSFFVMLRTEIGFYVACLNLADRLVAKGEPTSLPEVVEPEEQALSAEGLYDVCLTLTSEDPVVGNHVAADGRSLVMITGANQGGKSTFLRSVGLAQLMLQAGMFVGASSLRASVCRGLFTHYKREEDEELEGGKLDEELSRMSEIVDRIRPGCVLLCNESFASTNEREGSEIGRQVVRALLDSGVRVLFVTHMFDLAHGFHRLGPRSALFLRAERGADGTRPFKLTEGEPLPTSYGEDSYRKVFGTEPEAGRAILADARPAHGERV